MLNNDFTIIVDTREQQPWSFEHHVTAHRKLDTGDYSIEGLESIVAIERKKSVNEIANNIVESRFKDVISRLSQIKYPFILMEFDINHILNYPIGSNLPKKMWDKVKISPAFLMKNILDWQIKHNIKALFCGSPSDAEQTAQYILKKIHYLELNQRKDNNHEAS
jgi:hypothetical protein